MLCNRIAHSSKLHPTRQVRCASSMRRRVRSKIIQLTVFIHPNYRRMYKWKVVNVYNIMSMIMILIFYTKQTPSLSKLLNVEARYSHLTETHQEIILQLLRTKYLHLDKWERSKDFQHSQHRLQSTR